MILPLCCQIILTNGLVAFAKALDEADIRYELAAGSNLGALKMGATLPWEVDHDIHFQARNVTAIPNVIAKLKALGYRFVALLPWFCVPRTAHYYILFSVHMVSQHQ